MYIRETDIKKSKRPVILSSPEHDGFFQEDRNMLPPLRQSQTKTSFSFVVDWQISSSDLPKKS